MSHKGASIFEPNLPDCKAYLKSDSYPDLAKNGKLEVRRLKPAW